VKLVFVTQDVDPASPVLGATVAKLHALAREFDEVAVLALAAVPGTLPANCTVRTFGARAKPLRGIRFVAALAAELRGADAVLAHMCPIYAVLAAPLARPLRVPVLLWYAHWHASSTLRVATRLATRVLSVDERSYPLPTRKLAAIGHGIDFGGFPARQPRDADGTIRVLALGRYSPAKGLPTVLRAVAEVPEARLEAHGITGTPEEEMHLVELQALAGTLGVSDRVDLGGPVPRDGVPRLHAASDVLVNNMRAGAPDKVVYEACGSALPVVVSNPSFAAVVAGIEPPLLYERESAEQLAERLRALAALAPEERAAIGLTLRERVLERHSVESWARAVAQVVSA
jgi:glycosyltransferase involved in cell wall biosynthesis